VVNLLAGLEEARELNPNKGFRVDTFIRIPNAREFRGEHSDKHAMAEAYRVLASIGGVRVAGKRYVQFDYDPDDVIGEIVCSGCVPDHRSHQFYPTPDHLATFAAELLNVHDGEYLYVLEPSAGTGQLIAALPSNCRVTAVEVSGLHCAVLKSRFPAATVIEGDFLVLPTACVYDRVLMNPPFDRGQWQSHLEHAARSVVPTGKLVAILPASAKGKDVLPGWTLEWFGPFSNEFAGTSVSVNILRAVR
jgi:hypothetical protein